MKPLVSILIPAYNAQMWFSNTLESAVAQTWPKKEIIIVDDGSKDQTLAIARRYESGNVKVFSQQNQGAAAARNKAFSLSQGEYIQWLDADDLMSPNKIAGQVDALDSIDAKRTLLSGSWGRFMYRQSHTQFSPTALWCDLSPAEWLVRKMGQNLFMQTATWLVSREMTEAAGPWDTQLLGDDDGEYFCRVLLQSRGIHFVPESKVYYRASGASSLSYIGHSERKMVAQLRSMQLHVRYLLSLEDSERSRAACATYLQNWSVFFYPERPDLFKQIEEMSRKVGGTLRPPRLSWKYSWIRSLFGWNMAKRAQVLLPQVRWSITRYCDRQLSRLEARQSSGA
jgi:glycosyltransferase involved in cell wall biosynthesis